MIVPDVNLLVYAVFDGYPLHQRASAWLNNALSGTEEVGLTIPALRVDETSAYVDEWLDRPQVRFLAPGPEHVRVALALLKAVGTGANLTTDAQLAAYAIEFGGTVHSNDSDFGRFPGLSWVNPLA